MKLPRIITPTFAALMIGSVLSPSSAFGETDSSKAAEGATGLGAKRTKPARATQSKPPTVDVKKSDSQPAAGEKGESSEIQEIRQALSELLALEEGVESNQQIQVKKAALQAAIERGIKQDPKSVVLLLFGFIQMSETEAIGPNDTDVTRAFIQRAPELAVTLLDQVPNEFGLLIVLESIGKSWAASDLKAALAWANLQTDSKIKSAILEGVISSWANTDLQGALAYAQSLPPGDSQDRTISKVFQNAAQGDQGALTMMQSLPEGRTKDLAAKGITQSMAFKDPRAAWDVASGIGDLNLRSRAQEEVIKYIDFWSRENPAAALQWMQSLPVGATKEMVSASISRTMASLEAGKIGQLSDGAKAKTPATTDSLVEKAPSNVDGVWYGENLALSVSQQGNTLLVTYPNGRGPFQGAVDESGKVTVNFFDDATLYATLEGETLFWSNGCIWTRTLPSKGDAVKK